MTVTKRAELDMIGFDVGSDPVRQGQIALRWRKMVYVDGVLAATEYHRALIDADADISATLDAINQDLERQGYGIPPATDAAYIEAVSSLAWTPEVKAAVAADRKAKREEAEAQQKIDEAETVAAAEAEQARFDTAAEAAAEKAMDRMARTILFDGGLCT